MKPARGALILCWGWVGGWVEAREEGVDVGDGLGGMVWGVGIHGEWSCDRCGMANLLKFDKGPFLEL